MTRYSAVFKPSAIFLCFTLCNLVPDAEAQSLVGSVLSAEKISDLSGEFQGALDDGDLFGTAVAPLGDLNGDGVVDLAVGVYRDDDGGSNQGAVWVLFLQADGSVKAHQKISDTAGGFTGALNAKDHFGTSLAALGDLDGDGVTELAVGADRDDDGGGDRGAVWVLFLRPDGTVKTHQKISDTAGGFTGVLDNGDRFGTSVGALGDLDRDGVADLAVGAILDDDGGGNRGALWILFLRSNGTVRHHRKISDTAGGFTGALANHDHFGASVAALGDLDLDGFTELAVGADLDDDGGGNRGSVWILFLDYSGGVKGHQRISDTAGEFTGTLFNQDRFGAAVASPGDVDGDGVGDLVVGAPGHDNGGLDRGAAWLLFMNHDGTVDDHRKIGVDAWDSTGATADGDELGNAVAALGDVDGDGMIDLATGARRDDDGGPDTGAVWIQFLYAFPDTTNVPRVTADFSARRVAGDPPRVQFTSLSTAVGTTITSWQWDFENDGVVDSTQEHPLYVPQSYTFVVRLTVSDGVVSDTIVKGAFQVGGADAIEILPEGRGRPHLDDNMLYSSVLNAPTALYNLDFTADPAGGAEGMARQFLDAHKHRMGITDPAELVLRAVVETPSGYHVRFDQMVGGHRVYGPETVVSIDRENRITSVMNGYRPFGSVDLSAGLDESQLLQKALAHLRLEETDLEWMIQETVVYAHGGEARLVSQIQLRSHGDPGGEWELLVDVRKGEVLRAENRLNHLRPDLDEQRPASSGVLVNGRGDVFDPDPITNAKTTYGTGGFSDSGDADSTDLEMQLKRVDLYDITLDGGLYILQGPYAAVVDADHGGEGFAQPSSDFFFTRGQRPFEAVNVYHHMDQNMRYVVEDLGFSHIRPPRGDFWFDPHYEVPGDPSSGYDPRFSLIRFRNSGLDQAEDHEVIIHELGHGVHQWAQRGTLPSNRDGLAEGFSDYWAASYTRDLHIWDPGDEQYHWLFHWFCHGQSFCHRVTNDPRRYSLGLPSSPHDYGQIFSSTMMEVYDVIGKYNTDRVLLEALAALNTSSLQVDAVLNFVRVYHDMFGSQDLLAICQIFASRRYLMLPTACPVVSTTAVPSKFSFEGGSLSGLWTTYTAAGGAVEVNRDFPNEFGDYSLVLTQQQPTLAASVADAELLLDIRDLDELELRFWWRHVSVPYVSNFDEGVFVSTDGQAWYNVHRFADSVDVWTEEVVPLTSWLGLNDYLIVRFSFKNSGTGIDVNGYAFDEIELSGEVDDDPDPPPSEEPPGPAPGPSVTTFTISSDAFINKYRDLRDDADYDTGINTGEHTCGVVGFSALNGDIKENDSGDIIKVYAYRGSGRRQGPPSSWRIRAEFRTQRGQTGNVLHHENWNVDLLCLSSDIAKVGSPDPARPIFVREYGGLGDDVRRNTGISTNDYVCGIAGLAANDGDIQENGDGDIIKAHMYPQGGEWYIRAEFRTHGGIGPIGGDGHEDWNINVLCASTAIASYGTTGGPMFVKKYSYSHDQVNAATGISSVDYGCGVVGFAAYDGDINEKDQGDIIKVYASEAGGAWNIVADFHTHGDHEAWDVYLMCMERSETSNLPPELTSVIPAQVAAVGSPWSLDASAHFSDPDDDPLAYAESGLPGSLGIDAATGVLSGTPTAAQIGSRRVTVTADDGHGGSAIGTFTLVVAQSPGPVENLIAYGDDGEVNVYWQPPANDGGASLRGYDLERSLNGSSGWQRYLDNSASRFYHDTGRSNGTTYYYRVRAENITGREGPWSMVSATAGSPACTSDADCGHPGYSICDTATGTCVECLVDTHCGCDAEGNSCPTCGTTCCGSNVYYCHANECLWDLFGICQE